MSACVIAGMFALSPVVGWIADVRGRTTAILIGQGLLVLATGITAVAGGSTELVTVGLVLLGLGWSFCTVAASTLLADSVPVADRPRVQGTSDLLINLAGATAGALSGILVAAIGFSGLSLVAMALVLPATAVVLTRHRPDR